jgi:hypothetical protein
VEPSGVGAHGIEISIQTAPEVTWYKEIKAFDSFDQALGWVSTQDTAHGPVSMLVQDITLITNLVFTKAKACTNTGKKVAFTWKQDESGNHEVRADRKRDQQLRARAVASSSIVPGRRIPILWRSGLSCPLPAQ